MTARLPALPYAATTSTAFYTQYDDFVVNYNEKFGKPGKKIMTALLENDLRTKAGVRRGNRVDVVLSLAP